MSPQNPSVLIVDDEPNILELLEYCLSKEGFQVFTASGGRSALELANRENPDLVLLDIMMPDMEGVEVCLQLRESVRFKNTRIAFLTARTEDYSQIAGFEAGADDYITKPIKPRLLVARLKALLRSSEESKTSTSHKLDSGNVEIDHEKRIVRLEGVEIDLPKKEFDLLYLLITAKGKVLSREFLYAELWNGEMSTKERTLDVHIRKLRKKIGERRIITLKGIGYRFNTGQV